MAWFQTVRAFVRNHVTVEPVIFFYMAAIFMEMSITQDLMKSKICLKESNITDYHDCHNVTDEVHDHISKEVAVWMGYYNVVMFLFALLPTAYVGSWSDNFGFKIPMYIPPVGSAVAVLTLVMNSLILDLNPGWLLLSGAISGLTGGIVAIVCTTFGYVSHITSVEKRTVRVVILEANLYIGGTLGMIVGGAVHRKLLTLPLPIPSYAVMFFIEFGLLVIVTAYVYFKVDEVPCTLQPSNSNQRIISKLFSLNHIKESLVTTFKPRANSRRLFILLVLLASFLITYSLAVQTSLNFPFVSAAPLKWNQADYSFFSAASFGIAGVSLILFMPVFFHYLKLQDTTVALVGTLSKMSGLVLLGVSTTTTLIYLTSVFFIFAEFSIPALRSILSKLVNEDEKGKIFAIMQLIQNLSLLTGAEIFSALYKATAHIFKGLPYELVAGLQAIAILIVLYIHVREKPDEYSLQINEDTDEQIDTESQPTE